MKIRCTRCGVSSDGVSMKGRCPDCDGSYAAFGRPLEDHEATRKVFVAGPYSKSNGRPTGPARNIAGWILENGHVPYLSDVHAAADYWIMKCDVLFALPPEKGSFGRHTAHQIELAERLGVPVVHSLEVLENDYGIRRRSVSGAGGVAD